MKWRKITPWVMQSDCRQYFVVKHETFDGEHQYEPFFQSEPRLQPQPIAEFWPYEFKEAAMLCAQHQTQMVAA
jgi:hypothetical protein